MHNWYKNSATNKYKDVIVSIDEWGLRFIIDIINYDPANPSILNFEIKDIEIISFKTFIDLLYKFVFSNDSRVFKEFEEQIRKNFHSLKEYHDILGNVNNSMVDFYGIRFLTEPRDGHVVIKDARVVDIVEFENFIKNVRSGILDNLKTKARSIISFKERMDKKEIKSFNELLKKIGSKSSIVCFGGVSFDVEISGIYKPQTQESPAEYPGIDKITDASIENINDFEENFILSNEWSSEFFEKVESTVSSMKKYGILKEDIIFEMNGIRLYYKISNFKEPTDGAEITDAKIMDLDEFVSKIPSEIEQKLNNLIGF